MKVFICTNFEGHYPIGTAAVVVAHNITEAEVVLRERLELAGLPQDGDSKLELTEMTTEVVAAYILNDGNCGYDTHV